ncbi:RHS repeat domain-containing protein [Mucilaginibacter sp.]
MHRKLLFWVVQLLFVVSFQISSAQTPTAVPQYAYSLKQQMPTSPEAAMLGRFGDIPIGYYTGTADISIPLDTIKEDGLSIPIVLRYHNSGIKVADEATNVGLGWVLEPGGAIIQIINGVPDQIDNFVSTYPADYAYLKANVSLNGLHDARNQIGTACFADGNPNNGGDSMWEISSLLGGYLQPDIYQYTLPDGTSGKFFINPETNQPVCIDKTAQIYLNPSGGWIITTLDGHKFYFSTTETSVDAATSYTGYTWKLSKIITHNKKEIDFSYTQGLYVVTTAPQSAHTIYPVGAPGNGTTAPLEPGNEFLVLPHTDALTNTIQTINKITCDDKIVTFNLQDRQDIQSSNNTEATYPKLIQSMTVSSAITNKPIKTFNFNYSYFTCAQVGGSWLPINNGIVQNALGERLKLVSVQEEGYDNNNNTYYNPPYQFTYNESSPLPIKSSNAVDYWGYYNGVSNPNLIPDLTYLYDAGQLGSFPFYMLGIVPMSNRAPDVSKVTLGMLNKITYPTGGSTVFNYESNSFTNYNYPDLVKLQNAATNVYVTDNNSGSTTTATFTLPRTMTFTLTSQFEAGMPSNTVTFDQMEGATVTLNKIENGSTTILDQIQLNSNDATAYANGGVSKPYPITITYDPNAVYQLVASLPDNIPPQNTSTATANVTAFFNYYNVPNSTSNLSYGGGARVASIQNYDNTGALISNKAISYIKADGTSSGILMSPLQLTYDRMMHFEYMYDSADSPSYPHYMLQMGDADIWWLTSDSMVPFSTAAGGNIVGYSRVVETELANNANTNGSHVFYYNNLPSETGYNTPDNPNLLNGRLSEEDYLDVNNNLLKKNTFTYMSLEDSIYMAYKGESNMVINYSPGGTNGPFDAIFWPQYPSYTYLILEYPINSHWYVLQNKTSTEYYNGNQIISSTNYSYNPIGQLAQSTTTDSKNETLTEKYVYPYDQYSLGSTQIPTLLVDSSYFNDILEQHSLNNNIETEQTKIGYGIVNNQLVRNTISRSNNGGNLYTDWTFDVYGPNKTLQQVSQRGVLPSAFIYDKNNIYLLAEAKNAVINDIAYSSFEPNQPGNWTLTISAINTSQGFSGAQSYALSPGNTLSKSGLSASKTYVVSYWTQNSSPLTIAGTIADYPIKGVTLNSWTYYEHQVTGQTTVILSGTSNVDEVRLYPNNAQMNTWTYNPLIGITSTINEKNQINYYEYDGFQRLINTKDQYGNIIKHMTYHYQGQ